MEVNYRVYSRAPDGTHELGRFSTLSNAQCFMYAWAGLSWEYDPDCMSVTDNDGWTCFIMDENEWMNLDTEMDLLNY
jgi:hypothetical protein